MTNQRRLAELRAYRDTVADTWCQVIEAQDAMVRARVFDYLRNGSFESEMPTALIQAQAALLEALEDADA